MSNPTELARDADDVALLAATLDPRRYRVVRLIARGGMGAVFEAVHLGLGRTVALKVSSASPDGRFEERLRFEGRALAQLDHPALPQVFDTDVTADGRPFVALERLEGTTLRDHLASRGRLPIAEAVRIAIEVLGALGAIHRAGLVHRDVKLDNVFLCTAGLGASPRVVLLDLGIAKPLDPASPFAAGMVATAEGVVVGTPRSMAPEQLTFGRVDARADLYAVGVLLFWLVAGRAPFEATALLSVAMAHVTEPPPPASRFAPVPASLDAVILRALAKRPDERFPTAATMAEALASLLAEDTSRPRPRCVARTAPMLPTSAMPLAPWPFVASPPHPVKRAPRRAAPTRARFVRSATLALLGALAGFAAVAGIAVLRAVVG